MKIPPEPRDTNAVLFSFLIKLLRRDIGALKKLVVIIFVSALTEFVASYVLFDFIRFLMGEDTSLSIAREWLSVDYNLFPTLAGLFVLMVVMLRTWVSICAQTVQTQWCNSGQHKLACNVLESYINQPISETSKYNQSDILKWIFSGAPAVYFNCLHPAIEIIVEFIKVVVLLSVLFATGQFTAMVGCLIVVTFTVIGATLARRLLHDIGIGFNDTIGLSYKMASEAIRSIRDAKVNGIESFFAGRFSAAFEDMARFRARETVAFSIQGSLLEPMLVAIVVGALALSGQLGIGLAEVAVLFVGAVRVSPSGNHIVSGIGLIRVAWPLLQEISAVLTVDWGLVNESFINPISDDRELFPPSVSIRDVTFKYSGSLSHSTESVSLEIDHGQVVALVGKSGAGKSTLMDLMLGLLEPLSGTIKMHSPEGVRIGYVPQDVVLIDGTIAQNVALGVSDGEIEVDTVWNVLYAASLGDYVASLPQQIFTDVGENGVCLSGGQRQMVAIARALYRRPNVIFLDEATASLDNISVGKIREVIGTMRGHFTVVIIAHSAAFFKNCDKIFFMSTGRLVAQGSFSELMESCEEFRGLVEA